MERLKGESAYFVKLSDMKAIIRTLISLETNDSRGNDKEMYNKNATLDNSSQGF